MTELNLNEINNVGGGVTMSPDGRSCTDPRIVVEFPMAPDIELY
jgi:hypothetical protein